MNTYEAILIHPGVTGGRVSGNLHVKTNGIFFESGAINHHIGFTNLSINAGGAANRFIFFQIQLSIPFLFIPLINLF
ncbi:hypothetical protein JJC04_04700 [Flavobacterium covae]|nr:hypothetical protein [Flavobacterium covae]QYS91940.1 hypothetical protein JJC04_04700 [Flavobacterium covae]